MGFHHIACVSRKQSLEQVSFSLGAYHHDNGHDGPMTCCDASRLLGAHHYRDMLRPRDTSSPCSGDSGTSENQRAISNEVGYLRRNLDGYAGAYLGLESRRGSLCFGRGSWRYLEKRPLCGNDELSLQMRANQGQHQHWQRHEASGGHHRRRSFSLYLSCK